MLCFGQPSCREALHAAPAEGGLQTRQRGLVPSGGAKNTRTARFSRISWNRCSARAGTNTTLPGRTSRSSPLTRIRATADDVVHLVLGMGRLLVLAASREFVQATPHRRDP